MIKFLFFKLIKWINPSYQSPYDCAGCLGKKCLNLREIGKYCRECDMLDEYIENMENDYKPTHAYKWRFNAPPMFKDVEGDGNSYCDELVIGNWFHLERMNDRYWWLRIGEDLNINILLDDSESPQISIQDYGDTNAVAEMLEMTIKEVVAQKLLNR